MAKDGGEPATFQFVDMSERGRHNRSTRSIVRSRTALNSHRSGNRKRSSRARDHATGGSDQNSSDSSTNSDQPLIKREGSTPPHRPRLLVRKPPQSVNNFAPWPVAPEPAFPRLLHHLWAIYESGFANEQVNVADAGAGFRWVQRKTFTNTTYFYLNLLCSALDLKLRMTFPEKLILDIRGKLLTSLQADILNPTEANHSLLVLTVARMGMLEVAEANEGSSAALARGRIHFDAYRSLTAGGRGPRDLDLIPSIRGFLLWSETVLQATFGTAGTRSPTTSMPEVQKPTFVQNFLPFR